MYATALAPDAPLPTDVPTLQAMVRELLAELQKLRAENAELKTKLDAALKQRSGGTIASSTLGDWLFRASGLLAPMYELMHTRLLRSCAIHGDDTGVKSRVKGANRATKSHLWAYIGDADYPSVLFDFTSNYPPSGRRNCSRVTRATSTRTRWPSTRASTARTR